MIIRYLTLLLCVSTFFGANAQTHQLYIVDANNNEPLPFANIWIQNKTIGVSTNENGVFKLEQLINNALPKDTICVSYLGYSKSCFSYSEFINLKDTIHLTADANLIEEVLIEANDEQAYAILDSILSHLGKNYPNYATKQLLNVTSKRVAGAIENTSIFDIDLYLNDYFSNKENKKDGFVLNRTHSMQKENGPYPLFDFSLGNLKATFSLPITLKTIKHSLSQGKHNIRLIINDETSLLKITRHFKEEASNIDFMLTQEIYFDAKTYAVHHIISTREGPHRNMKGILGDTIQLEGEQKYLTMNVNYRPYQDIYLLHNIKVVGSGDIVYRSANSTNTLDELPFEILIHLVVNQLTANPRDKPNKDLRLKTNQSIVQQVNYLADKYLD